MKSKKLLFFVLIMTTLCGHLSGQTFNKKYIFDNSYYDAIGFHGLSYDLATNVIYCEFIYIDKSNLQASGVAKIALNSDVLDQGINLWIGKKAGVTSHSIANTKDYLYTVSTLYNSSYQLLHKIRKPDFKIDSIHIIKPNDSYRTRQIKKVTDSTLILLGSIRTISDDEDKAHMMLVDTSGNIIKSVTQSKKFYKDIYNGLFIDSTRNLIRVAGLTWDGNNSDNRTFGQQFVVEYDTNWNKMNTYRFNDSLQIDNRSRMATTDSSFFMTSCYGTGSYPKGGDYQNPKLLEINNNGKEIWQYSDTNCFDFAYNKMMDVKLGKDGSIYALASADGGHDSTDMVKPETNQNQYAYIQQAFLYKWNKKKELVWIRHIKHPSMVSYNTSGFAQGLEVLPDNSLLFCGYIIPGYADPGVMKQQGWLVRTDTNGCIDGQPCLNWKYHTVTIIDTTDTSDTNTALNELYNPSDLSLYPNPNSIGVLYSNLKLSSNNDVKIYSLNGSLVYTSQFKRGELVLPKSFLDGLYLVVIRDEEKRYSSRVLFY